MRSLAKALHGTPTLHWYTIMSGPIAMLFCDVYLWTAERVSGLTVRLVTITPAASTATRTQTATATQAGNTSKSQIPDTYHDRQIETAHLLSQSCWLHVGAQATSEWSAMADDSHEEHPSRSGSLLACMGMAACWHYF